MVDLKGNLHSEANPTRPWVAVLLLTAVAVLNLADRFLPSILAEPIKRDLLLSDTAIGLINGFGFLIVYAVIGVPIARLSDRGRYGWVIAGCISIWSVMTVLGGLAQTGWQLAMTRMGVALGEAGSTPAAHAFISRNFRPGKRSAPLAILTMSVPLASVAGIMGGGLLGQALGWRNTLTVIGLVGLLFAPVVLLVLGSRASVGAGPAPRAPSWANTAVLLKKKSYLAILAGTASIGVGGYATNTFAPAFLMRVHGMSLGDVGVRYGIGSAAAGVLSLVLTGIIADRLSIKDPRWHLWFVVVMIGLLLPFSCVAYIVPGGWTAIGCLALTNIVATAYMVPIVAAIQRLAPIELRATASAIMLFCTALVGGAGPLIVGIISDAMHAQLGAKALARALLLVPVTQVIAAALFFAASRSFRCEMIAEDERARGP